MKKFLLQLLISIDQLANVLLLGHADETLSARAYRAWRAKRVFGRIFKPLIDGLFFFDPDHCRVAYQSEVERRQLPPEMRDPN